MNELKKNIIEWYSTYSKILKNFDVLRVIKISLEINSMYWKYFIPVIYWRTTYIRHVQLPVFK